jgi:Ca2+-binding RTX toxin-like protein
VDSTTDVIKEESNSGTDTVASSITFSLAAIDNVENLTLTGSTAIHGTGNSLYNVLLGNTANNSLDGGAGNDTLDGGAGIDTLSGGVGDDTYKVDSITDVIKEESNSGTDTVASTVTFSLAAIDNVENLTLIGSTAINGTGNGLNNLLLGNSANNSLAGAAGHDILDGGAGIDTLSGGSGDDTYRVDSTTDVIIEAGSEGLDTVESSVTYSLQALTNVERLTLVGIASTRATGNNLDNLITGNAGSNQLTGGNGVDTLVGGLGDDTYFVDSTTDVIIEMPAQGSDLVNASVTFSLESTTNVENLTLSGTTAINATGNAFNNVLSGNSGDNMIDGGLGNDILTGGSGDDAFIFSTALNESTNVDRIIDFAAADDSINLSNAVFIGLNPGALLDYAFSNSPTTITTDTRIIYNSTSGSLSYDADGSGSATPLAFVYINPGSQISSSNFNVIG